MAQSNSTKCFQKRVSVFVHYVRRARGSLPAATPILQNKRIFCTLFLSTTISATIMCHSCAHSPIPGLSYMSCKKTRMKAVSREPSSISCVE